MRKYLIFTAIVVWGICAEEIARAEDPMRDVIGDLTPRKAHVKLAAKAMAPAVSHVQVCLGNMTHCGLPQQLKVTPPKAAKK